MLELIAEPYRITIDHDATPPSGTSDGARTWDHIYTLDHTPAHLITSRLAVSVEDDRRVVATCLLRTGGGVSRDPALSAIIRQGFCIVVVGPHLVSLTIPELELQEWIDTWFAADSVEWQLDRSTCFIKSGEYDNTTDLPRLSTDWDGVPLRPDGDPYHFYEHTLEWGSPPGHDDPVDRPFVVSCWLGSLDDDAMLNWYLGEDFWVWDTHDPGYAYAQQELSPFWNDLLVPWLHMGIAADYEKIVYRQTDRPRNVRDLVRDFQHSDSFVDALEQSAQAAGLHQGSTAICLYDFNHPGHGRFAEGRLQFVGCFPYQRTVS